MNTPEINLENKLKAEILNELEELTKWYGKTPEHKQWVSVAGHLTIISALKALLKAVVSVEDLPMMLQIFQPPKQLSKSQMVELLNSPNHLKVENAKQKAPRETRLERRRNQRKSW